MKTKALLLSAVVFALAIVVADCNHELDVLTAWKSVLADPNNVLQSWDATLVNPCTWFHVTCNADNSVTRVDLGNANLSGTLIPQLGQLPNLQYLQVDRNKLSGVIPNELSNLTNLVSLGVSHNRLSGPIPVSLGNLRSLRFLRLDSNNFSGILPPTIIQLISHGSLQLLNVSNNHLAGTVPATNQREFLTTIVVQDPKATNYKGIH